MTAKKYNMNDKFAYCDTPTSYHGIVKRIYIRIDGVFRGMAWYCSRCKEFTLDENVVKIE